MADRTQQPGRKPGGSDDDPEDDEDDFHNNFCRHGKRPGGPGDDEGDDGGSNHSSQANVDNRKKKANDDAWKFDCRLLKPPKPYDDSELAYFQPWLEMLRSEMMNKWEPWGQILEVFEQPGEKRLDPHPM